MPEAQFGIIGGSGLYEMPDLVDVEHVTIDTPFGAPSDALTIGTLAGTRVAFLPRHGRYHQYSPSNVPARANFWALKSLGVQRVVSVSAVGSLREHIAPLHMVVPSQVIDRTVQRPRTFFDEGPVAHVSLAEPFCPQLSAALLSAARSVTEHAHEGGTYVCIEGPQFSTKAESRVYRSWGGDIIGMTAMPEVRLAREAELCFAILAVVTDYDVWHETEESVVVEMVQRNLARSVAAAQETLRALVPLLPDLEQCPCDSALADAIVTAPAGIPTETRSRLGLLLDRYLH